MIHFTEIIGKRLAEMLECPIRGPATFCEGYVDNSLICNIKCGKDKRSCCLYCSFGCISGLMDPINNTLDDIKTKIMLAKLG